MKKEIDCCDNCEESGEEIELHKCKLCGSDDTLFCPDCIGDHLIDKHIDDLIEEHTEIQ